MRSFLFLELVITVFPPWSLRRAKGPDLFVSKVTSFIDSLKKTRSYFGVVFLSKSRSFSRDKIPVTVLNHRTLA